MILARNSITLHHLRDITAVVWYYKLQSSTASAPTKPTAATPSGWTTTEPSYTEGSTNSLYVCQKTTFSDGTFEYSDVSLSTSYEAAKAAYNKSVQAQTTANAAQESIDNLEIGGRNLLSKANVLSQTKAYTEENYFYTGLYGNGGGLKFPASLFEVGEKYVLSFKFKKISGTLTAIGGHCSGFSSYGNRFVVDGVKEESRNYSQGHLMSDDSDVHAVEVYLMFNGDTSDNNLYIQPNRGAYTQANDNKFQVWDLQLEKGNRKTNWTPAPEDLQASVDALQPELIVGTHGTTATATWTGTSTVLTEIKAGTRKQYKLSSAGASNVTLNLTLKNGTTTGAKNVYFLNTTRLGTQYGVNATIDLIYDGSAWRVLNPYTNSNTVGSYAGTVKAGTNGVYNYSLVMRDTADTWVSLTTSAGTGTSKARYTGGLYPDKVLYMGSNAAYAAGATTGTCYEALALNLNYSTNSGSGLTAGKAVYLVGEIHSDGLFYLDSTWWTQTVPTTENGKTYIYLGLAYNTSSIYLASENTLFVYYDGKFRTLREAEELKAAKTADNYLAADNTGIMGADRTDGNTYTPSNVPSGTKNTFIDEESFQVRDGTDVLASFGTTTRIGKENEAHLEQTATRLKMVDSTGNNSVSMGAESTTTKTVSEHYTSDDDTIYITLSPDLVDDAAISLQIGNASYNVQHGAVYNYYGASYTIAYDGSYDITVGNTLGAILDIIVEYAASIASGYGSSVEATDTTARVRVKTNTINGVSGTSRSALLATTRYGNAGLYDDDAKRWIIRSDINGEVFLAQKAVRIATIYNTKKCAPSTQSTYTYAKVQRLSDYNVVVVRA